MEVFASSTPTYSGNYKVFLETPQVEMRRQNSCRAEACCYLLKRNTELLASGNIDRVERVDRDDLRDERAHIAATCEAIGQ